MLQVRDKVNGHDSVGVIFIRFDRFFSSFPVDEMETIQFMHCAKTHRTVERRRTFQRTH